MTFPIPRPKAAEAPAKLPRRTNRSKAPLSGTLRDLPHQESDLEGNKARAISREVEYTIKASQKERYLRGALGREKADRVKSRI